MKKRLRYKMFNSCIVLKGYSAKEKAGYRASISKDVKRLRVLYSLYLKMRKKGIDVQYTFKKNGYIGEEGL